MFLSMGNKQHVLQRTPNVGVVMTLRKKTEAEKAKPCPPCPPCPCAPTTVGWLVQTVHNIEYTDTEGYERYAWLFPELANAYEVDPGGQADVNTAGKPAILRMTEFANTSNMDNPATVPQSWLFMGAPFGIAGDIRWEWTWNISAELPTTPINPATPWDRDWWEGHETEQIGQFIQVRIKRGYYNANISGDWSATLTAKAYCGEIEVGKLMLKIAMTASAY